MKLYKFLVFIFIVFNLIGCSTIQNREKSYLSAKSLPPLRIPPGVSANGFRNFYPVSYASYSDSAKQVDIAPPGLNS